MSPRKPRPRRPRMPTPSRRAIRWTWYVAVVLAALIVAWLVVAVVHLSHEANASAHRLDTARSARTTLRGDLDAQSKALAQANRRLRHAGEPQVAVPPTTGPPISGPQGEPGPRGPGPSNAQIAQAVASYCAATGACAGRGPTTAQVAAAVATYCTANGDCRGPQGDTGKPGRSVTGPKGEVGAAGPPPTSGQVADAVAAYCADGRCRGAQGEPGPAGPPGKDGTARPGSYACPDRQYVTGFTIAPDGAVTLACNSFLLIPGGSS